MKKSIVLPFLFLLIFASIANAEPNDEKEKAITASEKQENVGQSQKYTDSGIDTNVKSLPPDFYGNNPESVYLALLKREKAAVKGEFETKELFNKRIENESKLPIIGNIGLNDLLSFQARDTEIHYFADHLEFSINIKLLGNVQPHQSRLNKIKNRSAPFYENAKAIALSKENVISKK